MQAMVKRGQRMRYTVSAKMNKNRAGAIRNQKADSTAATKMAVPVADSQLSSYRASSGFGAGTTGGTRWIFSCRPATWNPTEAPAFSFALMCGSPQTKTNSERSNQGTQACNTW